MALLVINFSDLASTHTLAPIEQLFKRLYSSAGCTASLRGVGKLQPALGFSCPTVQPPGQPCGATKAPRKLSESHRSTTQTPRTFAAAPHAVEANAHACGRGSVARCGPVARRRLGPDQDTRRGPRGRNERRLSVERQRARLSTEPEHAFMRQPRAVPLHAAHSPARIDANRPLHRRVHLDGMHGRPSRLLAGEILRP